MNILKNNQAEQESDGSYEEDDDYEESSEEKEVNRKAFEVDNGSTPEKRFSPSVTN